MNHSTHEKVTHTGAEERWIRLFESLCPHRSDELWLLERFFGTSITIRVLSEQWGPLEFALDDQCFQQGALVLDQRLLLQHGETGASLLSVASLLLPDLLPPEIRPTPQMKQVQPVGGLFPAVSTQHMLLACECQAAGPLEAEFFALELYAPCLARTMLYSLDVPALLVHEVIPLRTSR